MIPGLKPVEPEPPKPDSGYRVVGAGNPLAVSSRSLR